jgi:hypothetical protein
MKKALHTIKIFGWGIIITLLFSCASTEKMLDEGRYDQLVQLAKRKIAGKKKKKTKYVVALEEAFNQLQAQDLRRIESLQLQGSLDAWEKVYNLSQTIERRQDALLPYLPVKDDRGYQAKFNFIKTHGYIEEAMDKVTQLLYSNALDHMADAREGNKRAARDAYYALKDIERYFQNYKDKDRLMNEAEELGLIRVWLDVENQTNDYLPMHLERELLTFNFSNLNHKWTEYYVNPEQEIDFDFKAKMELTNIFVGPESIHEDEVVKVKEIEDGWQYVLDENGNVLKDTLGNDVKEARWVKVKGSVLHTTQRKAATIKGRLVVIDLKKRAIVESRPIQANAVFEHQARRFFGDVRALNKHERRIVGTVPFPSDVQMITKASDVLKPTFMKEIKACRMI